ncbi:hypothetical protein CsSME_00032703 [Camellia sinensis var. sinensis]
MSGSAWAWAEILHEWAVPSRFYTPTYCKDESGDDIGMVIGKDKIVALCMRILLFGFYHCLYARRLCSLGQKRRRRRRRRRRNGRLQWVVTRAVHGSSQFEFVVGQVFRGGQNSDQRGAKLGCDGGDG